jgi:hypothetical protein
VAIAFGVIVVTPSALLAVEPQGALAMVWFPGVVALAVGISFGLRARGRLLVGAGLAAGATFGGNLAMLAAWARVDGFGGVLVLVWSGLAAGVAAVVGAIRRA